MAYQPAPRRQSNKNTKARGYTQDMQDKLENKAGQSRSIYGSRGRAPTRDDDRHAGYTKKNPAGPNTTDQTHSNYIVI